MIQAISTVYADACSRDCKKTSTFRNCPECCKNSGTLDLSKGELAPCMQVYGAVTMNNTLCLGLFLLVMHIRDLPWRYSSEVITTVSEPLAPSPLPSQADQRYKPLRRYVQALGFLYREVNSVTGGCRHQTFRINVIRRQCCQVPSIRPGLASWGCIPRARKAFC